MSEPAPPTGARQAPEGPDAARTVAEQVARNTFGRLVASLAWRWRDLAAAQDALSDALLAALDCWPRDGVPQCPEAWLTTVAKRRLMQAARHRAMADDPALRVLLAVDEAVDAADGLPDRRLALLFVCAHPDVDPKARTALMLQTVLGIDAARIASAFLVSPAAMAQRLVRAKQKIREARIAFDLPAPDEWPSRLDAVLEAIYAAFSTDWDAGCSYQGSDGDLADEAIFLARLVAGCLPGEPEAIGLLALLLSSHARRGARFDASGGFVPLARQDVSLWDAAAISEADRLLARAAALRRPGPLQLEAAIQSAHCQRRHTGLTPWVGIAHLHEVLHSLGPTVATATGFAVALIEAGDLERARECLDALPLQRVDTYQPYWFARWHLLRRRRPARRGEGARDRHRPDVRPAGQALVVAAGASRGKQAARWMMVGSGAAAARVSARVCRAVLHARDPSRCRSAAPPVR